MIIYDVDMSVTMHFEKNQEDVSILDETQLMELKHNIKILPDWVLQAISEYVDLQENDTISVMLYDDKLTINGNEVDLDVIPDIESLNQNEEKEGNNENTVQLD